ncbi:hypothetical protein QJS10_CPB18g00720 [Acorus calamus]|uniref:Uncharacterized protein n=1 Tax=Acorus calamus TaxID=4465 RepID=A0AAV9CM37_ACOCL|nr:hypothetical protein QJS10_CPB18g00720 [Acorus calamus]
MRFVMRSGSGGLDGWSDTPCIGQADAFAEMGRLREVTARQDELGVYGFNDRQIDNPPQPGPQRMVKSIAVKQKGKRMSEGKRTYEMSDEWWASFTQRHPGGDKFRNFPLAFEIELDVLFGCTTTRGDDVSLPGSMVYTVEEENNDQEGGTLEDESTPLQGSPHLFRESEDLHRAGHLHSLSNKCCSSSVPRPKKVEDKCWLEMGEVTR